MIKYDSKYDMYIWFTKLTLVNINLYSIMQQTLARLYAHHRTRMYIAGFSGFFIGAKLCDLIFFDPIKHQITR